MLSLIDKKIVIKREWGKNKNKELYWIDIPNAMREVYGKDYSFDLKGTADSKVEFQHLKNQEMTLSREIDTVNMQISNEELNKQLNEQESIVQNLKNRVNGAKERIAGTKSGSNKSNTPSSSLKRGRFQPRNPPIKSAKQIIKDFNYMRTEWKNRKEKCMDFLDNLSDAMEKKPKDVIKLLDIETDEAMGVKLPKKM
jgi:predicted RNase H-like nuclease (RuvC/YqgF family)